MLSNCCRDHSPNSDQNTYYLIVLGVHLHLWAFLFLILGMSSRFILEISTSTPPPAPRPGFKRISIACKIWLIESGHKIKIITHINLFITFHLFFVSPLQCFLNVSRYSLAILCCASLFYASLMFPSLYTVNKHTFHRIPKTSCTWQRSTLCLRVGMTVNLPSRYPE